MLMQTYPLKIPHLVILFTGFFSIQGCAIHNFDASQSEIGQVLLNGCYKTRLETNIYRKKPGSNILPGPGQFMIQSGLPINEWEFDSYGRNWQNIVKIPIATRFKVTRLMSQAWGFNGRHWLVYGRVDQTQEQSLEFIIPSAGFPGTDQLWITSRSANNKELIKFSKKFVETCD